ncbi:MAG: hypothetical protein F6K47_00495 [Symploca sp. SIO2E6]|nr:hypothetical protein [Symploca sp. SIO2E6]
MYILDGGDAHPTETDDFCLFNLATQLKTVYPNLILFPPASLFPPYFLLTSFLFPPTPYLLIYSYPFIYSCLLPLPPASCPLPPASCLLPPI